MNTIVLFAILPNNPSIRNLIVEKSDFNINFWKIYVIVFEH